MAKKETTKKDLAAKSAAKKAVAKKVAADPPAGTAKKAASVVLTSTDIADHLASTFDIPKSHAKIYLDEAVALINKHLKKGARIRMSGLGVFEVKKRAARKALDSTTGDAVKLKAGKRVVFTAARDLKSKL